MNQRLLQFLSAENITQAQFAETLGVARASISHILSGRNKPGYDIIESIMIHYPSLNMEWLICGRGKMFKEHPSSIPQPSLFEEIAVQETEQSVISDSQVNSSLQVPMDNFTDNQRTISKIVVFYSDNTFAEIK